LGDLTKKKGADAPFLIFAKFPLFHDGNFALDLINASSQFTLNEIGNPFQ
jgi:hypothetical protein